MLTRLLYPVEHVRLNIEYCILNNHKNELSYWLAEYYYSGFQYECMDWIIQIYYTYYAIQYPCFEKKIHKKLVIYYKEYRYETIVEVANNLRIKQHSTKYHEALQQPKQVNRGRKPSCLALYEEPYKTMIFLYSKKDWNAFYQKLNSLSENQLPQLYYSITSYSNNNQSVDEVLIHYYTSITQYYSRETIITMIFALALHLTDSSTTIIHKYGLWLPDKKTLSEYKETVVCEKPYQILKQNLKYKNRQTISKEQLSDILNNWLYYSFSTPVWRERIEKYNGYSQDNKIKFCNDDNLEAFHEAYGYELDEQSNEIYNTLYSVTVTR